MNEGFSLDHVRHSYRSIDKYLREDKPIKKNGLEYLNISASFDIESTSFFRHLNTGEIIQVDEAVKLDPNELRNDWEKIAVMYAWVFCYDGHAFTGRTWKQFTDMLDKIAEFHELNEKRFLVVGVHNLAFEFQFFRLRLPWLSVFATTERIPLYARTLTGFEFRCTLLLSGYSLAKVGEHLQKYPCRKMVGDLDYNLLRHGRTKLTPKEWGYIVNDGLVVCSYIQELIEENNGKITNLPYTKTGFVRKYLKNKCFYESKSHKKDINNKYRNYRYIMKGSPIGSVEEYEMLKQAFTGAIVHVNAFWSGRIVENVMSMDLTSAYPTQMVVGYFPSGRGKFVMPKDKKEFAYFINKKACLIDVTFHNIKKSQLYESLISKNKCMESVDFVEDNGRLVEAKSIRLVITEIDYLVYKRFYKWERLTINRMIIYNKMRLPTALVDAILDLYANKTELKGVKGKESELMGSKERLNACYGASVTDICQPRAVYHDGEWSTEQCDYEKEIEKYNNSKNRFLDYKWGVWVTSLNRRVLASAIIALGKETKKVPFGDYIYSDTDSVKFAHPEDHKEYFERYNSYMMNELRKASEFHGIPLSKFIPKTIEGVEKPLGVWDYDGTYKRFKALRSKAYAVEYPDGHHSLTIAGVNKKSAIPYIEEHEKDFFDFMHFGYEFNVYACGKKLHTYIDERKTGYMIDYLGKRGRFDELSSVHLMPTTYKMVASDEYNDLLDNIQSIYWIE